jgi:hypothetical protein
MAESEIEKHQYAVPSTAVGKPIPADRIAAELEAMRSALVAPYWAEVELRDTAKQIAADTPLPRKCIVIANDGRGTLLLFDPVENDFFLARNGEGALLSIGVRVSAVKWTVSAVASTLLKG